MKLFAGLGPGDIVWAARSRLINQEVPGTSIPFSEQLFDYCRTCRTEILAISSNSRRDRFRDGRIWAENRPKPKWGNGPIAYHFAAVYYAVYLAIRARRFRAELAIIDSGTSHYFALAAFWLLGVPVAVNLHNVLWPAGFEPTGKIKSAIRRLNRFFFRHIASGAIGVSPECERQVLRESELRIPFFQYRCQYTPEGFKKSSPYSGGSFHVACACRLEEDKGVMDLLEISVRLRERCPVPVIFHICGDGAAIGRLRHEVQIQRLNQSVIVHGHLKRADLLEIYAKSHVVIVPTRSSFCEGMPQVCAEAMLSDLPVVTNPVTNAADVIGSATVQAKTDDIDSYVEAILTLIGDRSQYERLRSECSLHSFQFTDASQGYAAALHRLLCYLDSGKESSEP